MRLVLCTLLLVSTLVSTARADGGDEPDPEVTELADDYAPRAGHVAPRADLPFRLAALATWMTRRLGIPRAAVRHLPARGERGALRWRVTQQRSPEGTTTHASRSTGEDCPYDERFVLQHDARGRLVSSRRLAETCEGVDSFFTEERFTYDARGRLREVVRVQHRRPIDVRELEDQELTDDLTLPDGTMPPASQPPTRCTFAHTGATTRMVCSNDRDAAQVEASWESSR